MIFNLIDDNNDTPIIKVIGVGGGGSNAVTHMYNEGIVGVEFAICNTDRQAMAQSPIPHKIHLGPSLTEGRGAGSKPSVGRMAAEESLAEVKEYLGNDCKMLFVTAGMGGGTGTGAAPIIAKAAQEMDILTVGIVTLPFTFEGRRRTTHGSEGLEELKKNVDTLIVISNDKLRQIFGSMTLTQAFSQADNILSTAAKGIAEIITVPGYVNVDFEDVNTVMRDSGVAIMGTATAEGDNRAKVAVDEALNSPLLEDNNIKGAQNILINITSGNKEVTMDEIFEITEWVQEEAGYGTNLIWGNCFDEQLDEKISVTVIATGFERNPQSKAATTEERQVRVSLDDVPEPNSDRRRGGLRDIGYTDESEAPRNQRTVEFDDIRRSVERHSAPVPQHSRQEHSYEDPYVKAEERRKQEEARKLQFEQEKRRKERLRNLSQRPKLNQPDVVNELENQPAYLRRGVELDQLPDTNGGSTLGRWTIGEDTNQQPDIREDGNRYLHDRVD